MNHKTSVKTNNRANQKNPNNDQHQKSRRHSPIPSNQKQKVAERRKRGRKAAAVFGQKNSRKPTGRLQTDAFHQSEKALHDVVPRAQLLKTGSRLKGTATEKSDWDYHIKTKEPMTRVQRDRIYRSLQSLEGSSAIALEPSKGGNDIDFFPQKAEWHDKVPVQMPGSRGQDCCQEAEEELSTVQWTQLGAAYFPDSARVSMERSQRPSWRKTISGSATSA